MSTPIPSASPEASTPCENCSASGTISRIYVREIGTSIRLAGLEPEVTPGDEHYFTLLKEHPNYNALYSLLLVAATNRYGISVRTDTEILPTVSDDEPGENATINYVVIDWE